MTMSDKIYWQTAFKADVKQGKYKTCKAFAESQLNIMIEPSFELQKDGQSYVISFCTKQKLDSLDLEKMLVALSHHAGNIREIYSRPY